MKKKIYHIFTHTHDTDHGCISILSDCSNLFLQPKVLETDCAK